MLARCYWRANVRLFAGVFLAVSLPTVAAAIASALDDRIDLGGFHPAMTLEEADRLAGAPGKRYCKIWPPNPTEHWCEWTFQDANQHVEIGYGPDGVIYDLERRVPLPDGMSDDEALRQAAEKFAGYGEPARDIIPDNLHWGCNGDDCSGERMIRVWIMEDHAAFFGGRRHIAISWNNRSRAAKNQKRYDMESQRWRNRTEEDRQPDRTPLKL